MNRLEGKVAIITGACGGFGGSAAHLFTAEGAAVALCDIDDVAGEKMAEELRAQGGNAAFFHLDVTDEAMITDVYEQINQKFGKITTLVNIAGITGPVDLPDEVSYEDWRKTMELNCDSVFLTSKLVIRYLREAKGGSIINVASLSGLKSECGGVTPYHVSKAAVVMLTKNFAVSYAKENIRVNAVAPGTTLTPLVINYAKKNFGSVEEYEKLYGPLHPMGRFGRPEEIAHCMVYLASDEASWTTGSIVSIDGGFSAC